MPAALETPPEDENLWSRILTEVQSRSVSNLPQGSVLAIGDNESGKTSLVARLQRHGDTRKGCGLEYHFLEVNTDYRDGSYAYQLGSALPDVGPGESARLGVWVLDGDPAYARLMRFALRADALDRSLVLLCASMAEPWTLLDSLQRWARALQDHLDASTCYDGAQLRDSRDRQVRFWQEYVEPLDSSSHSEMGAKVPSMETEQFLLPLGGSTLTHNLGIPLVVVITKCDAMVELEKEHDYKDEHFDFVQQHVRRFCLNYGAALIYTSVKESRNCDVLYKYVLHRVYGFPFTQPAKIVEKDSVFIPAGWDNEKKIGILCENLQTFKADDFYGDHIRKPVLRRPNTRESDVQVEEEQAFLTRISTLTASQESSSSPHQPRKAQAESPLPTRAKASPSPSAAAGKADKLSAAPAGAPPGSEGTLAQFFNNLLKAKPPTAGGAPSSPNNSSKSFEGKVDAQAELSRMLSSGANGSPPPAAPADPSA